MGVTTGCQVSVIAVGNEAQPVAIVDDFADVPHRLRTLAAEQDYSPAESHYPGVRSPVPNGYFEAIAPAMRHVLRDVLGISGTARFTAAYFALATTPPVSLRLPQRIPHIDSFRTNQLAFVHFLCGPEQGGTAFYRHRRTGFETVDRDRHQHFMDALQSDFTRDGEPQPAYINGSTPLFEQTAVVEAQFNRAVLYRGNLLHCAAFGAGCTFSSDPAVGRLTVTAFLDVA